MFGFDIFVIACSFFVAVRRRRQNHRRHNYTTSAAIRTLRLAHPHHSSTASDAKLNVMEQDRGAERVITKTTPAGVDGVAFNQVLDAAQARRRGEPPGRYPQPD
jgi:hypothetical protein